MDKAQIILEIQRTALENGGCPLGQERFERLTGISVGSWRGKYWRNWGDAVRAAGLLANQKKAAHERSFLIASCHHKPHPGGASSGTPKQSTEDGYVYMALMKIGREKRDKIGRTNLIERRASEISSLLPAELELVHAIRTDDASGIESYWHNRFKAKNTKGEWFTLSLDDIRAFKKLKFI